MLYAFFFQSNKRCLCGESVHLSVCPSVSDLISATEYFLGFSLNSVQMFFTKEKLQTNGEFRENRRLKLHCLLTGVNEFMPVFSVFI
jgi:hypothetical protein